jgi:hypothetical protein
MFDSFSMIIPLLCICTVGLIGPVLSSGKVCGVERDVFLSANNLIQIMTLSSIQKRFTNNPDVGSARFAAAFSVKFLSPGLSEFSRVSAIAGAPGTLKIGS